MKVGDRIRLQFNDPAGNPDPDRLKDFTVEEFRHCLGVFLSEDDRKAGAFTPLCQLYGNGPESEDDYISNWGPYRTNQVPVWMDLPRKNHD